MAGGNRILMNILWAALAICVVVAFVFYVLALSWQRTLGRQSRAIHTLYQRLEALESLEDPFLRRRVNELAPSQLEEVSIFSLNFSERFWCSSLGASESRARRIRENAAMLGSVKFEIWRSHIAITVTELLPSSRSTGWQNRVINIYDSEPRQPTTLWELSLEHDTGPAIRSGRILQLRFWNRCLELVVHGPADDSIAGDLKAVAGEQLFFCIPLDSERLSEHRIESAEQGEPVPDQEAPEKGVLRFSDEDENLGIAWRLSIRILAGGGVSDKWRFVAPAPFHRVS